MISPASCRHSPTRRAAIGWRWKRSPGRTWRSSINGLHPTVTGSYLAALVMYAKTLNRSPVGLPARLRLRSGAVIAIDPQTAVVLHQVAATVAGY
jgi:hypothetical protein